MAFTVTSKSATGSTAFTPTRAISSGSFTPVVGAFLIVTWGVINWSGGNADSFTISDSWGLSWTALPVYNDTFNGYAQVLYATATTASSGTVTITGSAAHSGIYIIAVDQVEGGVRVAQTKNGSAFSTTPSLLLSTPSSSSLVVSALVQNTGTGGQACTGYTQIDLWHDGEPLMTGLTAYKNGSASATVAYTGCQAGNYSAMWALEITSPDRVMTPPKFVCGAECGIAVVGQTSAGTEHWSAVASSPSVVTSGPTPMRSVRCFRFNPSATTNNLTHTFAVAIASPATIVARLYVYFATLPDADTRIWSANTTVSVVFKRSDSTFRGGGAAVTDQASGGYAITAGVWYQIDVKGVRDTTITADLSVNGAAQTQYSVAGAAATFTATTIGIHNTCTADMYIDNLIASDVPADYPIGAGTVAGLYPNADKPNTLTNPSDDGLGHFYSAVGDFGKGAGGATNLAAQQTESTSYQSLAKPLSTSVATNFIADILGTSSEHLVHLFEDLPVNALTIQGMMLVAASHSATTTANNFFFGIFFDSGAVTGASISADLSETSITIPVSTATATFTVADINALHSVFTSSDVNPDVYLDGACLEVAYTEIQGPLQAAKARRR